MDWTGTFYYRKKKDLIVKGGMNIFPKDIEDCLDKIEGISENSVGSVIINDEERIVCWYSGDEQEEGNLNMKITAELGKNIKLIILYI